MATTSAVKSVHGTLTGAATDTVNLQQPWDRIEVLNRDAAVTLYFTIDGTTPVVAAANTEVVPAGAACVVRGGGFKAAAGGTVHQVILIGSSNAYSVTGLAGN